jgi:DivIVA domain-containing protein
MLTPDEIRSREFLVSLRGYDRDEVHGFLDHMAKYVRDLHLQLESLQAGRSASQPVPAEPALAPPLYDVADTNAFFEDLGKTTQRILEAAHEAGSEIQRKARNEADCELAAARAHAEKLIAEGQRRREVIEGVVRMLEEHRAALAENLRGVALNIEQVLTDLAPRGQLLTPDELLGVAEITAPDATWVPPEEELDADAQPTLAIEAQRVLETQDAGQLQASVDDETASNGEESGVRGTRTARLP